MAESSGNLRNEDFRKLLTSARSNRPAESTFAEPARPSGNSSGAANFRHKQPKPNKYKKPAQAQTKPKKEKDEFDEDEAKLKDIMKNYRDRAAERRKQGEKIEDPTKLTAAYRAVPGDARAVRDQAEQRKQEILESKYLGGDIEHTHLVKGLDYSLLNKVRSEIAKTTEEDDDDDLEVAFDESGGKASATLASELAQSNSENPMVRSMHRILFKTQIPQKNDLFAKGRMAYVVELDEEGSDIPTTLLRSLHDCPRAESAQSIQANNLIINKLTQVLSYLRSDKEKKKKKEDYSKNEEKSRDDRSKAKGDSIYDDLDEYVPSRRNRSRSREKDDRRDRDRHRSGRDRDRERDRYERDRGRSDREYFEKPSSSFTTSNRDDRRERERQREKDREAEEARKEKDKKERERKMEEKLEKRRKETESAGYDECYPGGLMEMGGAWDSDEETDFGKMDMGAKKNGLNRWDFDTEEEYASYMDGREALPKAAYQYGVKMSEGRKTRKSNAQNEAKKLDRELNEINKIMEKRKNASEGNGEYKKPKY